jgi:hypothetical protein
MSAISRHLGNLVAIMFGPNATVAATLLFAAAH